MSKLTDTRRAYAKVVELLGQELRKQHGSTRELEAFRETVDVAFYLLGWAQFEYKVREQAGRLVEERAKAKTIDHHAWLFLKENLQNFSVRRRLALIFHSNPGRRDKLSKDYSVRNDAAHDYKRLPREARDIVTWLNELEEIIDEF